MYAEQAYLTARTRRIAQHFPTAIGVDDFLNRLEVALFAYGFTGDNSIGRVLTRDSNHLSLLPCIMKPPWP